jgi:hypothetical protein
MKLKSLTTLTLLFVFVFYVVQSYALNFCDYSNCGVTKIIVTLEDSKDHSCESTHSDMKKRLSNFDSCMDDCENCHHHVEHQQPLFLSNNIFLSDENYNYNLNEKSNETYDFKTQLEFYKPPTS